MRTGSLFLSLTLLATLSVASDSIAQHMFRIPVDVNEVTGNDVNGIGGGWTCVACTALIDLVEQYTQIHSMKIDTFVSQHLCDLFPDKRINSTCQALVKIWGPKVISVLAEGPDPDDACNKLKLCVNPKCNLVGPAPSVEFSPNWREYASHADDFAPDIDGPTGWLKSVINRVFDKHLPLVDIDGDKFSSELAQLRGYHWKGKDCDDLDKNVYPGRKSKPTELSDGDYNCNGIHGINPQTKKSYKEELCDNTNQMGVAVFGDSAGAHFELPPQWFNASEWSSQAFQGALGKALDEFDLPHKSMYTGYFESTEAVPVRSLYKYMAERNLCNHRDYQNMGVNGGASGDLSNTYAFARDHDNDHPALMFLELVGNDVCGRNMTEPQDFYDGVVKILRYIDSVTPAGSHLVLVGLADGRVLYDTLHDRYHPIGVKYPVFYEFLLCTGTSPCYGWMNPDAAVRENTYKRAMQLTAELPKIIANEKFNNFDLQFYPFPIKDIMTKWTSAGNDPAKLIEPVDGFHPSQIANALLADWLWEHLQQDQPEWLGEENPNNETITKLFGNQGGY